MDLNLKICKILGKILFIIQQIVFKTFQIPTKY